MITSPLFHTAAET